MNMKSVLFTVAFLGFGMTVAAEMPKHWISAGSHPAEYAMTVDRKITHTGHASGHLKCKVEDPAGFGTLMQTCGVGGYRGKRLRLSGFLKSTDAAGAGLWFRVDGSAGKTLSFDNMSRRAINGTTDWKKYEIVLDVPEGSESLYFGILTTTGELWMDDLKFEEVDKSVPVTDLYAGKDSKPTEPQNLNFEEDK